ncbi:HAD-IIIA family hydrolase [Aerosakkonema sp. BLCC-F183]|uniref:HAD-IIIA family hydrolase n=1 Tax=Aerosakkonema sp. BLCC-F183 TaxID=3342834 RepID=UPI0035BA8B3F
MIFFFDLDGTLRQTKSGSTFINNPDDQQPIPGAEKAVKYFSDRGYQCIGITNQGGVAAGHKTIEDAIKEQQITLELFPELKEIYFCPDFEGRKCYWVNRKDTKIIHECEFNFRKPHSGIIMIVISKNGAYDKQNNWMVGDRTEDFECAKSSGINFIWADIMLDKFNPGIHERTIANIDKETLLKFLAI